MNEIKLLYKNYSKMVFPIDEYLFKLLTILLDYIYAHMPTIV